MLTSKYNDYTKFLIIPRKHKILTWNYPISPETFKCMNILLNLFHPQDEENHEKEEVYDEYNRSTVITEAGN